MLDMTVCVFDLNSVTLPPPQLCSGFSLFGVVSFRLKWQIDHFQNTLATLITGEASIQPSTTILK